MKELIDSSCGCGCRLMSASAFAKYRHHQPKRICTVSATVNLAECVGLRGRRPGFRTLPG